MILVPGYRDVGSGEVVNTSVVGNAWLSGKAQGENAPYAGHNHNGNSNSNMDNRRFGHSVIPVFGERTSYLLWIIMFSLSDIFTAYYDCRRHKRNTYGALEFELHYESECIRLWNEIKSRTYKLQPCTAFIVRDPVQREIFASHFRDRVVHHLIARQLEPILEKILIHDVYNSRKGKGTHYGIRRVEKFFRSCSDNYQKDAYVLKLDISGFFMSIEKHLLFEKVRSLIARSVTARDEAVLVSVMLRDEASRAPNTLDSSFVRMTDQDILLFLIRTIIFTDVKKNVKIIGKREDWVGLPRNKSLFCAREGSGLPIGNLTSQLFANIYMHDFDTFVKKTLKVKYYGRYVDDFILIHMDKEYLTSCICRIRECLQANVGLTLHPKKIYLQHISKGVLFLGTYIKPWRKYIGRRTKGNFWKLIERINGTFQFTGLFRSREGGEQIDSFSDQEKDTILAQMNSYLGLMSHSDSYRLKKKMMGRLDKRFLEEFSISLELSQISIKTKLE